MKAEQDNPAVEAAVAALKDVIVSEGRAGRFDCSMWSIIFVMESGASVYSAGCCCPTCTRTIADVAEFEAFTAKNKKQSKVH